MLIGFLTVTTCIISLSAATFQTNLSKQLVGEWRNVYMNIIMHSYNNTNQTQIMEADSTNWEQRLQIKPIRTYFKSDGTYYSEYRDLTDKVERKVSGKWNITRADTLVMMQLDPEKVTLKLHLSIDNDHATFRGLIDFDGDGKRDDEYYGIQKKYSVN